MEQSNRLVTTGSRAGVENCILDALLAFGGQKSCRKDRPRIRGDISGHLGRKSRVWKRIESFSLNLHNDKS